jgi:uncharacterized protein YndB with AHSA1/START domain
MDYKNYILKRGGIKMILSVNVENIISSGCDEVYEAIVDPEKMSQYFISEGSGSLESGMEVIWRWDDVGAELPIKVLRAEKYNIEFLWFASGIETRVLISLEQADEKTIVRIVETGWESSDEGIKQYGQQIQGWVDMMTCLKAYLEFGINLRAGKNVKSKLG